MEYTINKNSNFNSLEISFNEIPNKEVRESLKALKFKWHNVKKIWYGYSTEEQLISVLNGSKVEEKPKRTREEILKDFYCKENKNGYSYGAWNGSKYIGYNDITDINKEIRKVFKELYPNIKLSVKGNKYSGGQSTTITLKVSEDMLCDKNEYIEKYPFLSHYQGWYDYRKNGELISKYDMTAEDYKDYAKYIYEYYIEEEKTLQHQGTKCELLNDYGNQVLNDLHTIVNAYNYDDSDSMTDYFSALFYTHYNLEF